MPLQKGIDGRYIYNGGRVPRIRKSKKIEHTPLEWNKKLEATKRWWIKNKEKKSAIQRKHNLQKKYGMSLEQFESLLKSQNNVCKICGNEPPIRYSRKVLFVDHCHITGKVRGLLCVKCNLGIGHLDTVEKLESAISYLKGNQICL